MTEIDLAYVALASVPGIGPRRLDSLIGCFGEAALALSAPWPQLRTVPGISPAAATAIKAASMDEARRNVDRTIELGGVVLTATGVGQSASSFPSILRQIPSPPPVLYAMGDLTLLEMPTVAMVGSRDHTRYGADACRTMVEAVGRADVVTVSGMARGIDAVAHRAALDCGASTVGVLGNGLGVVYPAANRQLYEDVAGKGCLLTEFPPGERPNAGSFPRRNRLISGLAKMTVVVEAAERSGALITADCALEQGREVGAVPGPITSPLSAGCNNLIAMGAKSILSPNDILEEYGLAGAQVVRRNVSEFARPFVEALSDGPKHVDQLALRLHRTVRETLLSLTTLELEGSVSQEPGKVFRLL